jgi:hypothetical protein
VPVRQTAAVIVIEAPRRAALLTLPTLAGAALLWWASQPLDLYATKALAVLVAFMGARTFLRRLRGRVTLTPEGVSWRVLEEGRLAWTDVTGVLIVRKGPWRSVQLWSKGSSPLRLPAPTTSLLYRDAAFDGRADAIERAWREATPDHDISATRRKHGAGVMLATALIVGALVVVPALFLDRPWHRWWWPGVEAASAAPDPCAIPAAVLAPVMPAPRVGPSARSRNFVVDARDCAFEQDGRVRISVRYEAFFFSPGNAAGYVRKFSSGRARPLPEVGPEALALFEESRATVRARRGNVYIEVRYTASDELPPDRVRDLVTPVARAAYDAVDLR